MKNNTGNSGVNSLHVSKHGLKIFVTSIFFSHSFIPYSEVHWIIFLQLFLFRELKLFQQSHFNILVAKDSEHNFKNHKELHVLCFDEGHYPIFYIMDGQIGLLFLIFQQFSWLNPRFQPRLRGSLLNGFPVFDLCSLLQTSSPFILYGLCCSKMIFLKVKSVSLTSIIKIL